MRDVLLHAFIKRKKYLSCNLLDLALQFLSSLVGWKLRKVILFERIETIPGRRKWRLPKGKLSVKKQFDSLLALLT